MKWKGLLISSSSIIDWSTISCHLSLRNPLSNRNLVLGPLIIIWQEVPRLISFEKKPLIIQRARLGISAVLSGYYEHAIICFASEKIPVTNRGHILGQNVVGNSSPILSQAFRLLIFLRVESLE